MSQVDDEDATGAPDNGTDVSAGQQLKDTFSELGNDSDNEGERGAPGDAEAGPAGDEPVRDWPPVHLEG